MGKKYEVNSLTQAIDPKYQLLVDHLLEQKDYPSLQRILPSLTENPEKLTPFIELAWAILTIDLDQVELLAAKLNYPFLNKPKRIQRKVYFYSHYLELQYQRQEFADYFRALTPVMVDILRLIIEQDFMPDLNHYLIPVIKNTSQGVPLYRGLQWFEQKVEADNNYIHQTFKKHYGDHFNYDYYVSSSHLLKLIEDHSSNALIKEKVGQMRLIEKYLRNIIAHEVVCVDRAWVKQRMNLEISQVHELYQELIALAGLANQQIWQVFDQINQDIQQTFIVNQGVKK